MHLSRRRLLYGSVGVAAVSVAGCSADEESADLTGYTGIAMPTTGSERWIIEGEHLQKELEKLGYQSELEYGEDDIEDQVAQIQSMIDKGVDFLVIGAIDNTSLGSVLAEAKDRGVTVIAYDRLILDTPDVDYYASFDNYEVGVLQATHILERLGVEEDESAGPFNIELFSGAPDDSNSEYFFLGGLDTLERYTYSGVLNIVSGQTEQDATATERWDGGIAKKRMGKLLDEFYEDEEIHAVLAPYDGISRGVVEALEDHGYTVGDDDFPVITGQDAEAPSVKAIRDESGQSQTVFKDTRKLGDIVVEMISSIMDGNSPQVNDLGTYNNGFKFVPSQLITPVNIDQSNWEEELVDSDYLSEEDLDEA